MAAGATLSVDPQVAAVVPALVNDGLVNVGLGGVTVTSGQTAAALMAGIGAGRNGGTWDGATGITSTAAADMTDRAVGWIDNGGGSFTVGFAALPEPAAWVLAALGAGIAAGWRRRRAVSSWACRRR